MTDKPIDDGGPAFPVECAYGTDGRPIEGRQTGERYGWETGMSLRDWFAGQALAGHCASAPGRHHIPENAAVECYAFADAMIAARKATR